MGQIFMNKYILLALVTALSACSNAENDEWIYAKTHDPVSGTETSSATRRIHDKDIDKSVFEVRVSCENSVMWFSTGSYYDNSNKDGELDGDAYAENMAYNLDGVGQSAPIAKFNESSFNNEYKYRFDYLIGNSMTVSDASGSRAVNVFDMMKIPNKLIDILPASLAMRLENSHGTHTTTIDLTDSSVVKVAQDCGWQTGTPVRYKLSGSDFPSDEPSAASPEDQASATDDAEETPPTEAPSTNREIASLPNRAIRNTPRENHSTVERHDLKDLMGGAAQ